jgi:hypothetical protein
LTGIHCKISSLSKNAHAQNKDFKAKMKLLIKQCISGLGSQLNVSFLMQQS